MTTGMTRSFEVVPERDKDLPPDQQRVFVFRHPKCDEWIELSEIDTRLEKIREKEYYPGQSRDIFDTAKGPLNKYLIDWRIEDVPYEQNGIGMQLYEDEVFKFYGKFLNCGRGPGPEELKNSDTQSPSGTEGSANDVPEPQNAKTQ